MQAAFAKDAGTLPKNSPDSRRHVEQVRLEARPRRSSVADVFNLIVKENGLLAGVVSGTPNTGASPAPITDPEKMQEALKASYINLQKRLQDFPTTT